jgi:hypothetical protein
MASSDFFFDMLRQWAGSAMNAEILRAVRLLGGELRRRPLPDAGAWRDLLTALDLMAEGRG